MKEMRPMSIRYLATAWLIAFLPALALSGYSFLARFVPSDRYLDLFQFPALFVAVLLATPTVLFRPRSNHDQSPIRAKLLKNFMRALIVVVLAYVLRHGLLVGAPSAAHHFAPSEGTTRSFTVHAKAPVYYGGSGRRSLGRCAGKVYLQSEVLLLTTKACGVAENDWRRVSPGDEIELRGDASWFGLKYSGARLRKN